MRDILRYGHFNAARLLTLLLLPFMLGFSPQLIEDINIVAIQSMQLSEEQGPPVLDVRLVIRNSAENALKLLNCEFKLAIAVNGAQEIPLGTARKDEVLLEPPENSQEGAFADTEVPISIQIEQDVQELAQKLATTPEIAALLAEPAAAVPLPVHLQGQFDLAVKANRSWGTQPGIRIDWLVTPQVEKQTLAELVAAMTAGPLSQADDAGAGAAPAPAPETNAAASEPQPSSAAPFSSAPEPEKKTVVYFASGSTSLDLSAMRTLQEWAQQHQDQAQEFILHIEGHADSTGTETLNQELSIKRAGAVYVYLSQISDLTWKYVVIEGFGQTRPAMSGDSDDARSRNRRVEVYAQADEP